MAEQKVRTVQRTGMDLATFSEITLKKVVPPMEPIDSIETALARVNNDNKRLLEVITRGLQAEHDAAVIADPNIPWRTLTDEGKLNGDYTGTLADAKKVNAFVLIMAKTQFGFDKSLPKEAKAAAKEKAKESVKSMIAAGILKADGFMPSENGEDEDEEENAQ
jgi:hypothetical protein